MRNDFFSYYFYRNAQKEMNFNYDSKNIDTSTRYSLSKLRRCQNNDYFLDTADVRTLSQHLEA